MYDQKLSQIALNEDFCVQIEVKKVLDFADS